jgi:hypothetical protein
MTATHCSFDPRYALGTVYGALCRLLLGFVARRSGQGLALPEQGYHFDLLRKVTKSSSEKGNNGLTQVCLLVTFDWVVICAIEVVEHDTRMRDLDIGLCGHVSITFEHEDPGMSLLTPTWSSRL